MTGVLVRLAGSYPLCRIVEGGCGDSVLLGLNPWVAQESEDGHLGWGGGARLRFPGPLTPVLGKPAKSWNDKLTHVTGA